MNNLKNKRRDVELIASTYADQHIEKHDRVKEYEAALRSKIVEVLRECNGIETTRVITDKLKERGENVTKFKVGFVCRKYSRGYFTRIEAGPDARTGERRGTFILLHKDLMQNVHRAAKG